MFKLISLITFLVVSVLFSGCGGGGNSKTQVNVDDHRPIFKRSAVLNSPSYLPSGSIYELNPVFIWPTTTNATDYEIGHQDISDDNTWESFYVTATEANCDSSRSTQCSFKSIYTFAYGEERAWWIRSKNGGIWQDWTSSFVFTVNKSNSPVPTPQTLLPFGIVNTTTPSFTWNSVANASEYIIGYAEENTENSWEQFTVLASSLNCQSTTQDCTFTPPANTFKDGNKIEWWMRVKVAGNLGEWSSSKEFTVSTNVAVDIPTTLSPIGTISTVSPSFKWTAVANATEYKIAYAKMNVDNSWEQFTILANSLSCQTPAQDCSFTLPTNTFKNGDVIEWWMRAKVAGTQGEWSIGKEFTVTLNPVINEVLVANTHTNTDPDFIEFSDWIELYNPSNQDINLSGYGLSDNSDPLLWIFPTGTTIKAKSYLMVWADEKNTSDKALHTNFKLSSKGETLTLADSAGVIVDTMEFNKQNSDISASKQNGNIVFMSPTPDQKNSEVHTSKDRTTSPIFSYDGGFHDNPIALELSQNNNADIFYTVDGSTPDLSSTKYTQAINITQTSAIRAVALESSGFLSEIITQTYFINHNSTLPIISITVDPSYLYDPKIGIYVEGDGTNGIPSTGCNPSNTQPMNYAQEWERPVFIEYFSANKQSEFAITAGMSISGQCSIELPKKSFSIDLDSKYGSKTLEHQIFTDKDIKKFKKFKLRAGGYGYEIGDILAAYVVQKSDLNIDYQAFVASQIFVNGEYWGLYNIRERKGKNFITTNYPTIDKDDLTIISAADEIKAGNLDDFNDLVSLLYSNNLDLSNNTDYQEVLTTIDEDNYIDYMALMIYTGNNDWIVSNNRYWKDSKNINKWRWMLDDVDSGFEINNLNLNQFNEVISSDSSELMVLLFKSLTKNSTFKQKFKSRFINLLDTTFSTANLSGLVTTLVDERKEYIPLEESKWGSYIIEEDEFIPYVQSVKDFVTQRNAIVRSQLDVFIP